ncbi:hypothetical protein Q7P37_003682 [Cladosporium fusiforme]
MAEVAALPGRSRHHRQTSSISNMMTGNATVTEPTFEMVPNPTFSFPMQPRSPSPSNLQITPAPSRRRPTSMHLGVPGAQPGSTSSHRRTTSALPSFSFNSANTTGLQEASPDESATDAPPQLTPRRGHKRGGSEFVGGDSRFGFSNALSTSPTRATALPTPVPSNDNALPVPGFTGRRGHAHRRSAALSSHDVMSIMLPTEESAPRMSTSLPNTPLDHPAEVPVSAPVLDRSVSLPDTDSGSRDSSPARPGSRPRVGFSENVEIIPRPLSVISSEGSFSTSRGHSVNNSITSVISMGSPPPRNAQRSLSASNMASIVEQPSRKRSSMEMSRRVEREGEWLKTPGSPVTEASASSPSLSFAEDELKEQNKSHKNRHSLGRSLGFDRRKSEPSIGTHANEEPRVSAMSLQHGSPDHSDEQGAAQSRADRRSSTQRLREWAASKLHRRSRELNKIYPTATPVPRTTAARPKSDGFFFDAPGMVPMSGPEQPEPAAAETDLDAVFGGSDGPGDAQEGSIAPEPRVQFNTPTFTQPSSFRPADDDSAPVVDLDDAMSLSTPPLGSTYRKQLHSAARSNNMPTAYLHRRTESAPVMMPFDFSRTGTPQSSMADVFEEEEEEDPISPRSGRPHTSSGPARDEGAGIGISIVDADSSALNFGADESRSSRRNDWEAERPSTSYGNSSRLSAPLNERRGSSIMEETIAEEVSPVEVQSTGIEIVPDDEEPRAPSLTKSSDSSDTPTLLASQREGMFYPTMAPPMMTPETYQTSTFSTSSPGRPCSFDTPRLGTSASSINDNRTVSSCTTGEPPQEIRMSVDDVPSLTSSRSTMFSTAHANNSHRDFSGASSGYVGHRSSSGASSTLDPNMVAERRRKRSSIQSLSQLMGGSFGGPRTKASEEFRPQTASAATVASKPAKKEHRLKKLMFWRSKQSSADPLTKLTKESRTG